MEHELRLSVPKTKATRCVGDRIVGGFNFLESSPPRVRCLSFVESVLLEFGSEEYEELVGPTLKADLVRVLGNMYARVVPVSRHHQHGRWQARIGRVAGNKDLYLGTFSTEEEAAEAYDIAAIKFRGLNAVTNFEMNRYDVKSILESNSLPIGGGAAKRLKEAQAIESSRKREEMITLGSNIQYGSSSSGPLQANYPLIQQPFENAQPLLTLQNQDLSLYNQESQYQSYIQTQLQLHQQSNSSFNMHQNNPFYSHYFQNNPVLLHGLMNVGSSSFVIDNNGRSSTGSYSGGYIGNGIEMNSISAGGGSAEELALVKVDYDMPSATTYTGWSGDSAGQDSNPSVFTMWNDG
ncbi:AP2-like ethylene-responsive transcription factor PLT2 [Olea europaea var. sylvestris]|uniref:AP2-like ethylene-responsive transcription factor PLT2 n=1 Tax=Olea europaea var. sylvestris TaxID=158386 RepID=UPI000C1D6620|nr:AP2-like ethylene-responsive transcription factor PLT2 [Olea europaea var. sylvestris]